MRKAILFDMDGVLVHSEPVILEAAIMGLREYGIEAQADDFRPYIGTGENRYIGGVTEKYGVKFIPEMKKRIYDIYDEIVKDRITVVPGAFELLDYLSAHHFRMAIVSSADRRKILSNLSAAGISDAYFEAIVSGEDVVRRKPYPDIYLEAAGKMDLKPDGCMVIEDAVNGIQSANAAGMECLALTTSFSADILEKESPGHIFDDLNDVKDMLSNNNAGNVIWSCKPAGEWAEGYPIANGRIGAMVLGRIMNDRIGLNHDLLWRRFWSFQEHHTASDLPEIRRLCAEGKWDDAHDIILRKIPFTGNALYLNPFVPAADLGIYPSHGSAGIKGYKRQLDLDAGITEIEYTVNEIKYKREYFCSFPEGILVIRLSCERAGVLGGEVTLSRLLDPDCVVTGSSRPGEIILKGEFEEGVSFAAAVRIIQHGGRLSAGKTSYIPPAGEMPPKDLCGLQFIFRSKEEPPGPFGLSSCYDSADEVLILLSISTDDGTAEDPVGDCLRKLYAAGTDFQKLKKEHISDHRKIYRRTNLKLCDASDDIPTDVLLQDGYGNETIHPLLYEKLFNMGRYLAITSGRPQPEGQVQKSPINLQGIWNQDRRPAWDCDYHLDLNLEMCYWPLELVNLGELVPPLMDWAERLSDQGRRAAADLYGCRGVLLGAVNDKENIGNIDNIVFCWTGASAWIAQILWMHWEYSGDEIFLRNRLYPFLKSVAEFYEDFLITDEKGRLVPCPSGSPEMNIKGRKLWSLLSSPSTIDLELIREVFTDLLDASEILGIDISKRKTWTEILEKVPLPFINKDGMLCEWLEEHEPGDPGHRHRSNLIGLCPGDRITLEDAPEYFHGAKKALEERHNYGRERTQSLSLSWDAQIFARLYEAEEAIKQLNIMVQTNVTDNLLITCNDWKGSGKGLSWFAGTKVYQIEASICTVASISEMIFQDRRGLLRFLPALPKQWNEGYVTGLRARGGFEVDIEWRDNRLHTARITSLRANRCRLKVFGTVKRPRITCSGSEIDFVYTGERIIEFDTDMNKSYILTMTDQV
jgi:alpha-L-fucosidase 2